MSGKSIHSLYRILVVDDEPMIGDLLEGMLALSGYNVQKAQNGEEALKIFASDRFDLVITDYLMPAMKGDELSAGIKAHVPGTPVVMITGMCDTLEENRSVDSILAKPFTREKLVSTVEDALARTRD